MINFLQIIQATDIIGLSLFAGSYFVIHSKVKSSRKIIDERFNDLLSKWHSEITDIADNYNIDISYASHDKTLKKKYDDSNIFLVGHSVAKGYDFFHSKFGKNFVMDFHFHNNSSEFFYVLSGTIRISTRKESTMLKAGEFYYLKNGVEHMIESIGEAEVITISMPSLLKKKKRVI